MTTPENNIAILNAANITIPKGATGFHTEDSSIVFFVKDWPAEDAHYQGRWHTESLPLDHIQKEILRSANRLGSFGWELEVTSRGYNPND